MDTPEIIATAALLSGALITAGHYGFAAPHRRLTRIQAYAYGTFSILFPALGALALMGEWPAALAVTVCAAVAGLTTIALYWIDDRDNEYRKAREDARLANRRQDIAHRYDAGRTEMDGAGE